MKRPLLYLTKDTFKGGRRGRKKESIKRGGKKRMKPLKEGTKSKKKEIGENMKIWFDLNV